ncbi:FHA domain-containing protein [Nocardia seriolae]|uniref:FHA domain-containing protein n=1 Tax=Nocardia seriolae TaxID=37332 RepID=A0A0B8NMK5_9NOCA|nr:FHA domain-containing protein [Nocardia seriolae]APA98030.1 hypothetical protein NS506_03982 [Nocardia seriolae]MTJ62730.1 FHA domain-containing protein [Nocardia seriolae]MTJ74424.1 FHA domain-containing protein [Nocardia seriolae]MTJ87766.1 FHA domain-containing protein [Nocardia seriolae]MTK31759.1 FHA domain-containing protein [Nocardia seriolae]
MAYCPEGHPSTATAYCDVCGTPIGGPSAAAGPQTTVCPDCGAPFEGRFCENCGHDSEMPPPPLARRVEPAPTMPNPGDPAPTVVNPGEPAPTMLNPAEPAPTVVNNGGVASPVWIATVSADPAYFARMRAQKGPDLNRVDFPDYYPDRRILLAGPNVLIGKRSVSQGVHPDIDLSIAPADVAVSRSHAILHLDADGATVTDLGSTNGTCLNDSPDPIPPKTAVPLRDGDRIHVGGWTTITVSREQA